MVRCCTTGAGTPDNGRTKLLKHVLAASLLLAPIEPAAAAAVASFNHPTVHQIAIVGPIEYGETFAQFRAEALQSRGKPIAVLLNSTGGNPSEAKRIGRAVRTMGATTIVLSNATCVSACFSIFVAGAKKGYGQNVRIGSHAAYNGNTGIMAADTTGEGGDYDLQMGVPLSIIGRMMRTPPSQMYFLSGAELSAIGATFLRDLPSTHAKGH